MIHMKGEGVAADVVVFVEIEAAYRHIVAASAALVAWAALAALDAVGEIA